MVSTQGVKGRGMCHDTQGWVFKVLTLTNCFAVPRSPPTLRREDSQHDWGFFLMMEEREVGIGSNVVKGKHGVTRR